MRTHLCSSPVSRPATRTWRTLAALALASLPARAQPLDPTPLTVGEDPRDVVVADFDQDGHRDLAVVNTGSANVSVLWGHPGGQFAPAFSVPVAPGPVALSVGDVDGDGALDLVTANGDADSVSVARGRGDGTFFPAWSFAAGLSPRDVAVGDWNDDGLDDLVVALTGSAPSVVVLLATGHGLFAPAEALLGGADASAVALADLDGIGGMELVVADTAADGLHRLGAYPGFVATPADPAGLSVGDVDGDGRDDVVSLHAAAGCVAILSGADPSIATVLPCGAAPIAVAVGDLQGDELADLVLASDAGLAWMPGVDGAAAALVPGGAPRALVLADLDGDHLRDVVAVDADGLTVWINDASPWVDLGGADGGLSLAGTGAPQSGAAVSVSVRGGQAGNAWLVAGVAKLDAAFAGGVLVPDPLSVLSVPMDVPLSFHWPAGVPGGASVYLQAWQPVAGSASGSNALRVIAQDG